MSSNPPQVGDIYDLNSSFMGEAVGTLAVVYDTYPDFDDEGTGICIITKNGVDIGGFSAREQEEFLTFRKHGSLEYEFRSVMYLAQDFRAGVFKGAFE